MTVRFTFMATLLAATLGTDALAGGSNGGEQTGTVSTEIGTGNLPVATARETATLHIEIFDYAKLEPAALGRFLSLTQDILAGTGMSVQVSLCRGNGVLSCDGVAKVSQPLVVRIVAGNAKEMENARREPLGQSYADHRGGTMASIFLAPARDQAAAANVPWVLVLSYAAAHEVGHLLLGDRAHTSRGLMRAHWDRGDYMAMSQNRLHFTNEQALILADRYGAPATGHNGK
jgi:hypothetical protein